MIDVLIPPNNMQLNLEMAERLIKSAWYANADAAPDKFVILVDTDKAVPEEVLGPFKEHLTRRVGDDVMAAIQHAYAQQHLEAWYFADAANLRCFLGRALGSVDTSRPDEIQNPKLHLRNVLGDRVYTARVAEEIARTLDSQTIAQRSPSFKSFIDAVMNGNSAADTDNA